MGAKTQHAQKASDGDNAQQEEEALEVPKLWSEVILFMVCNTTCLGPRDTQLESTYANANPEFLSEISRNSHSEKGTD